MSVHTIVTIAPADTASIGCPSNDGHDPDQAGVKRKRDEDVASDAQATPRKKTRKDTLISLLMLIDSAMGTQLIGVENAATTLQDVVITLSRAIRVVEDMQDAMKATSSHLESIKAAVDSEEDM
uniref:Uncharacterized protein n=1 Tax=Moniliophthora roreri TaxID=221103 RepID=A0A0W0EZQ2_MONRR